MTHPLIPSQEGNWGALVRKLGSVDGFEFRERFRHEQAAGRWVLGGFFNIRFVTNCFARQKYNSGSEANPGPLSRGDDRGV